MKLSVNLETNKKMMEDILPIGKSFDLIQRDLVIGGKRASMYFIDGFVKDGVVAKMITFLLSVTPEKMQDIHSAKEFASHFISYVEVSTEQDVDRLISQYLAGPAVLMLDGFDEAI